MIAGRMDVEHGRRAADSGLWPRLNQEPPPWPQQGSQGGSSLRLSVELDLFGHGLAGMAYGRRTRVIQVTMAHVKRGERKFLGIPTQPFAWHPQKSTGRCSKKFGVPLSEIAPPSVAAKTDSYAQRLRAGSAEASL